MAVILQRGCRAPTQLSCSDTASEAWTTSMPPTTPDSHGFIVVAVVDNGVLA